MIWGVVRWTGRPVFAFGWTDHTKPWTWRKSEGPATRSPKQMAWTPDWIKISLSHRPDTPLHKCTGHLSYHWKNLHLRRFKTFSLNRAFSAPLDPHKDPASTICPHALCPTLFLCNSFRPRNTFCESIHTGVIAAQAEFQSRITALTQRMVSHYPWFSHQICWSNYRGQFVGS